MPGIKSHLGQYFAAGFIFGFLVTMLNLQNIEKKPYLGKTILFA